MGLFDWLFGKPAPKLTPLGEFLAKITLDKLLPLCETNKSDMKVAMAATLFSLYSAHHFWRMLSDMAGKFNFGEKVEIPHDIVAFEAAAYANHFFLKDLPKSRFGDDENAPRDPYDEAMTNSVTLTYKLIQEHLTFKTSHDFYVDRVLGYQMPRLDLRVPRPAKEEEVLLDFERLVISSMARGYPAGKKDFDLGGMRVEIGMKLQVQNYHNLTLPAAVGSVRDYHKYLTTGQLPTPTPAPATPAWSYQAAAEKCMTDLRSDVGGVSPGSSVDLARKFRKAAEQGVHDEQAALQAKYGDGEPDDPQENIRKCRRAAEEGHEESQFHLGVAYSTGVGVSKDFVEAVKWYQRAAAQGQSDAQFLLGCCFHLGEGVTKSPAEAVLWYQNAVQQGSDLARFLLGACFAEGFGVAKDPEQALKFYKMASGGDARAQKSSRGQAILKRLKNP